MKPVLMAICAAMLAGGASFDKLDIPQILRVANEEGQTTNLVNQLCADGSVCAVKGHQWRDGRAGEYEGSAYGGYYLDFHPGIQYRTCRICGRTESKKEGDWK